MLTLALSIHHIYGSRTYGIYSLDNTTLNYGLTTTSHNLLGCAAECGQQNYCFVFTYMRKTKSCVLANKCLDPSWFVGSRIEEFEDRDYVYANLNDYPLMRTDLARGGPSHAS